MKDSKLLEIREYLFNKFNSCLDTAIMFDLNIEPHYRRCGNCSTKSKHPCSCGRNQKEKNLKDMMK